MLLKKLKLFKIHFCLNYATSRRARGEMLRLRVGVFCPIASVMVEEKHARVHNVQKVLGDGERQ